MAKSKHDMLTQLRLMWKTVKGFHEQLTIKEETFELPDTEDLEILHVAFIREGYKWLLAIYETEFLTFQRVWKLIPPKQWESYRNMPDMDDLQEVVMLKEAKFKLRGKLVSRDRPDFFKKGKLNGQVKKKLKESGAAKA